MSFGKTTDWLAALHRSRQFDATGKRREILAKTEAEIKKLKAKTDGKPAPKRK